MGRALRVVVTGAAGMLGRDVVSHCAAAGDHVVGLDRAAVDVGDRDAVLGALTTLQPDVVVHAAAWTDVDACEGDPERAFRANALGARWVADGCRRTGAHLVHLSTDYVFDGTKATGYHEWDTPNPLGVYGASKAAAEREVLDAGIGATVVRTSWLSGAHGRNIVATVLGLLAADAPLRFVDDQRGCPTFSADLAAALRRLAVARMPGLYHVTNTGVATWYGVARAIAAASGADPDRVVPITTAELRPPRAARRPANSVLENATLRQAGGAPLPPYEESLGRLVAQLRGDR